MTELHVGAGFALRTLAQAAAEAKSGDTVVVHVGMYREPLKPPAGTTWLAAEGETRPVIDGGWDGSRMKSADGNAVGILVNRAGVTVRGLEVRNVAGRGVAVAAGGDGFVLEGCEIHHTLNGGIIVNGTGTPVAGVTIRGCHLHDISLSGTWYETPVNGCCRFAMARDVLVEDTLIERGHGEGIDASSRSSGVVFRRVTVRDTTHLAMYVNRAQNVLIEECALYQRGLAEFRQGDGDVGAGLVIGDEESGDKDNKWQHSEDVTIRGCLVVNTGVLFTVRNNRKTGSTGKADGYNTTIRNLTVRRCTFVAGPDTRAGVSIDENPWSDGNVAGQLEANVFIVDGLAAADVVRCNATGVVFDGNGLSVMPPRLAAANIHIDAAALVAPFATLADGLNINNYRPRAGNVLAHAGVGALEPLPVEPPPPVDPPPPVEPPVDWDGLIEHAAALGVQLATATTALADAHEQVAVASLAQDAAAGELAALLAALNEAQAND